MEREVDDTTKIKEQEISKKSIQLMEGSMLGQWMHEEFSNLHNPREGHDSKVPKFH